MGPLSPSLRLAPTRGLVNIDTKHCLGYKLTGQKGVGRMYTSQPSIAEKSFDEGLFEDAITSCQLHRCIDDLPGALDRPVLDGHELGPPHVAVVSAVGPILGNLVEVRADSLEFERHIGNGVLDFRVVGHGA